MEGVRKLQAREWGYARLTQPLYATMFPSFLDAIREDFYRNFALLPNDKGVPAIAPIKAVDFTATWVEQFDQMLEAVETEWDLDMEEEIADAHDEGWYLFLWMLDLQDASALDGVDPDFLQVPDDGLNFALAASFGGVMFYERARMWRVNAVEKLRQQLQALAVTGQATWPEVNALTTKLLQEYRNGLDALALDELFLARVQGEQRALDTVGARVASRIQQLWLTRDDEKVCPRCGPLHLTLTQLLPILDTHPRCRCIVVPLVSVLGLPGGVSALGAFIRRLTRESATHSVAQL